jgi:lysyl-tRNA synthetase class 2
VQIDKSGSKIIDHILSSLETLQVAQAAAAAAKPGKAGGGLKQPDDDSLDPNQFYERRVKAVKNARDANIEPYPHKFETSIQVPQYVVKYSGLPDGEHSEDKTESIAGGAFHLVFLY